VHTNSNSSGSGSSNTTFVTNIYYGQLSPRRRKELHRIAGGATAAPTFCGVHEHFYWAWRAPETLNCTQLPWLNAYFGAVLRANLKETPAQLRAVRNAQLALDWNTRRDFYIGVHFRFKNFYRALSKRVAAVFIPSLINETRELVRVAQAKTVKRVVVFLASQYQDAVVAFIASGLPVRVSTSKHRSNRDWLKHENAQTNFMALTHDVVVDIALLADTDMLVGGPSNVFSTAMVLNPMAPVHIFSILRGLRGL
jgi:hypothetical protein